MIKLVDLIENAPPKRVSSPEQVANVRKSVELIKTAPEEDRASLEGIAKNMYSFPWYWEMSDARNTEDRAYAKLAVLRKLASSLENEESEDIAVEVYNIYAPKDRKIKSVLDI
jgi:hypothetical protein